MNPTLREWETFFTDEEKKSLPKVEFKVISFQKTERKMSDVEKMFVQYEKPCR